METETHKPISRDTVARALAEFGVVSKKKKKATLLSEKNRKNQDSLLHESTSIGLVMIGGR